MKKHSIRELGLKVLICKNTKHNTRLLWKRLSHKDLRSISKKIKITELTNLD